MADLNAVRTAVEPVLLGLGLELVDLDVAGSGRARTLRLTIDRRGVPAADPEGVDLHALAAASEGVSAVLDRFDHLAGPYTLEVSSPGVERPLRRPGDFRRFVGSTVSIKSHEPVSGSRRHRGVLLEADDEGVALELDGERQWFVYAGIAQARTVFEWGPAPKPTNKARNVAKRPKASAESDPLPRGEVPR